MRSLLIVFLWAMGISFLGTLPMGSLNVVAMQISVEESVKSAYMFAFGAVLVEMTYVRVALVGINWIMKRKHVLRYMEWATFFIILALAIGSFIAAVKGGHGGKGNFLLSNQMNRFSLGVILNALNAVQIPFWFGWSTVMITKGILKPTSLHYNVYVIALGLGTLLGKSIYILGGPWIINKIAGARDYLNWVIGGVFAVTAIIQLIRILRHKGIETKMAKLETTENQI